MSDRYHVEIPDFAGPMDLLVFLVRRRELDVAYISVSAIATDYLTWIDAHELIDLDNAGDFVLLAAILLQFKTSEILPSEEPDISEFDIEAERPPQTLEELLALKAGVARLAELEEQQINLFERGGIQISGLQEELAGDMLSDISMYDLAVVFRDLIKELPEERTHLVEKIPFTLEGQIAFVLSFFRRKKKIAFEALAEQLETRLAVIMTFLAMLELMRRQRIEIRQPEPFGQLWLLYRGEVSENIENEFPFSESNSE